jgi:hypothetical protein
MDIFIGFSVVRGLYFQVIMMSCNLQVLLDSFCRVVLGSNKALHVEQPSP